MANITVSGNALTITSSVTLEDMIKIQKYSPESLVLKGGEDGKEEIFRVAVGSGSGNINKFGAEFSPETNNGFATITVLHGCEGENVANVVADKYGCAIVKLQALEDTLPATLAQINADRANILSHITVI